jgi:hypothetical protein
VHIVTRGPPPVCFAVMVDGLKRSKTPGVLDSSVPCALGRAVDSDHKTRDEVEGEGRRAPDNFFSPSHGVGACASTYCRGQGEAEVR